MHTCERLRSPPFPAKYRGHRGQTGETQHSCGFAGHGVPGTNRGHIGDRPGTLTLLHPTQPPTCSPQPIGPNTSPEPLRPLAHIGGSERKGVSPGAHSPRRVHLWITFTLLSSVRLLKKKAVWISRQALDLQHVFPIMCKTCSITHIPQRALCIVNVLFCTYLAHYRENLVSLPQAGKGATHDH